MKKEQDNIRVAVRVRPPLPHEEGQTFDKLKIDKEQKMIK